MKNAIKNTIDWILFKLDSFFNKIGILIIPRWRAHDFTLIRRMKRTIKEYNIDCIIDVGANIGQYKDSMRKEVGFKGLIISYEPDPECFEIIKQKSKKDDLWVVEKYAIGDKEGVLKLNIMEGSVFNSFLEPDDSESDLFSDGNTVKKVVEVPVKRLDDLIPELMDKFNFKNIFLKLDTQGFDLEAFTGTLGVLDVIKGVQTEVSFTQLYKNAPTFDKSVKLFKENGFEVSGMYSLGEFRFPHALEHDCIYLPKQEP